MAALIDLKGRLLETLKQAGVEPGEADREVQLILQHVTGRSVAEQLAEPQWMVPEAAVEAAEDIARRRQQRQPLQYLLGEQWFMGLRFAVEPGVLIPRPDTETLVETVLGLLRGQAAPLIMDVGTGSGAIAISLLKLLPAAAAVAIDVSSIACRVAAANAAAHGVTNRLRVYQCEWLRFTSNEPFDAVVSNPPYVHKSDLAELQPEVAVFEPKEALLGSGEDGLGFFRDLSSKAKSQLRKGGLLALEVGYGQADAVRDILRQDGWISISVHNDLNRVPRCICAFHAAVAIEKQA